MIRVVVLCEFCDCYHEERFVDQCWFEMICETWDREYDDAS